MDPPIDKVNKVKESTGKIEQLFEVAFNGIDTDLSMVDKLNYDLFIAYGLNTLFWMYLRVKGINPHQNEIKSELSRIKDIMVNAKEAIERHKLRKTIDVAAAERFIKHGISHKKSDEPNPKKRKHE